MIKKTASETTRENLFGFRMPLRLRTLWILSILATSLYLSTSQPGNTQQMVLINQETTDSHLSALGRKESVAQASSTNKLQQGTQVSLNGRTLPIAWSQWQQGKSIRTGISDTSLMQSTGVELLNTSNYTQQPVQWFSPLSKPLLMTAKWTGSYRYLDITDFARTAGWRLQVNSNTLQINSPSALVQNIQEQPQIAGNSEVVPPSPRRIVVELDKPTPWKVSQERTEAVITIEGSADPALIERYNPPSLPPLNPPTQGTEDEGNAGVPPIPNLPNLTPIPKLENPSNLKVESSRNQTTIRVTLPTGWRSRVSSLPNPSRLIIDITPDAVVERNILWAPGLRWRQQIVSIGSSRFPVVWLEINLRQPGLTLKPILSNPTTLVGTAPLTKTAILSQASAAVNAGFFNRNEQLPLGAIRRDGQWLSSPILNRGAIAWNNTNNFKIAPLSLQETLITSTGERLPILYLNSGYVQAGVSRYTPAWGLTYTPLTDNETLAVVQNNQVTSLISGGLAVSKTPFPIPSNGYLLTIRANPQLASLLAVGTILSLESITTPSDFSRYPHILGGGPLLLQNRQIVLDAKAEKFSDAFIREAAIRTTIATTASSTLIIAAFQNRTGGAGPTLTETAQIMQKMGAVDALNLDGGSSTSLYLGGQLINRSPSTAARVHNGIGIFLQPRR